LSATQIVTYRVDEETTVDIEIEPVGEYVPAGVGDVVGTIRSATEPAVKAARVLLDDVKELAPDDIQITFGIKVSGTANWLLARASAEGNFEVTLSWHPADR
jgi:NTP-dependent ternary system trypsin peptidase co-occuring protein